MTIVEFMWLKLLAVLVVVGVVSFVYALLTGRSPGEDWSARKEARRPPGSED